MIMMDKEEEEEARAGGEIKPELCVKLSGLLSQLLSAGPAELTTSRRAARHTGSLEEQAGGGRHSEPLNRRGWRFVARRSLRQAGPESA